jgi:hypothetical protein
MKIYGKYTICATGRGCESGSSYHQTASGYVAAEHALAAKLPTGAIVTVKHAGKSARYKVVARGEVSPAARRPKRKRSKPLSGCGCGG